MTSPDPVAAGCQGLGVEAVGEGVAGLQEDLALHALRDLELHEGFNAYTCGAAKKAVEGRASVVRRIALTMERRMR